MHKAKQIKLQNLYKSATAAISKGEFSAAEKLYYKILKDLPKHHEILNNLAFCLAQQNKKPEKIEQLLIKAIDAKTDYKDGYINLIQLYRQTERPIFAIKTLYALNEVHALSNAQWIECAKILLDIGQFFDAYEILGRLVDEHPDYLPAQISYANVSLRLGDNDTAKRHFKIALQKQYNVGVLNNLAMSYFSDADKTQAEKLLRESITKVPEYTEAYRNLSMLNKFSSGEDKDLTLFESTLARADLVDEQKVHLHFALGKAYDDCKSYEKAFQHYDAGNKIQARLFPYSIEEANVKLEGILDAYAQRPVNSSPLNRRDDQPIPIFIVGMPRSGTSLLEQIFSSVDGINALGELTLVENQVIARSIEDNFYYPIDFKTLKSEDFNRFAENFYSRIKQLTQLQFSDSIEKPAYIIDKQPFNFWHVGLILQFLPHAKIIHSERNPLDTCLSNYFQFFHGNLGYVSNLKHIGQYYQLQERLMDFWKTNYGDSIFTVNYQNLVENPQTSLISLFKFLDIPWSDDYLKFYESNRPVRTLSLEQVRQPIYTSSLARWRNYQPWIAELLDVFAE